MKLHLTSTTLWPLGAALLIGGMILFGWLPLQRSIETLQKDIADKRLDLATLQEDQVDSSRSQNEAELTQQKKKLDALFLSKTQILEFLSDIEETAVQTEVTESITLDEFPDQPSEAIIEQAISLQAAGEFQNVVRFLHDLETKDYYLNFNSLSLNSLAASSSTESPSSTPSVPREPAAGQATDEVRLNVVGTSFWQNTQ